MVVGDGMSGAVEYGMGLDGDLFVSSYEPRPPPPQPTPHQPYNHNGSFDPFNGDNGGGGGGGGGGYNANSGGTFYQSSRFEPVYSLPISK